MHPRSSAQDWVHHHDLQDAEAEDRFMAMTEREVRDALGECGWDIDQVADCESIENPVFAGRIGSKPVVAKFYRPSRWSRAALLDEATTWLALRAAGLPVVPLRQQPGDQPLGTWRGVHFALFEHVEGLQDPFDGWSTDDLIGLGELTARMHKVTATLPLQHRLSMHADAWTEGCLRVLEGSPVMPDDLGAAYAQAGRELIAALGPRLRALPWLPVHGDLALNNIILTPDGPVVMDLDDMSIGPALQDLCLLHFGVNGAGKGTLASRRALRARFAEGYRRQLPFDETWLELAEAQQALRIPWFDAWIAALQHDPLAVEELGTVLDRDRVLRGTARMTAVSQALDRLPPV